MTSFLVIRGPGAGTQIPLRDGVFRIGRDTHCELQFDDTETSRTHAELRIHHGQLTLKDLGSSNGTFVNGKKITELCLTVGDRVQIGRRLLVYRKTPVAVLPTEHEVDILPANEEDASQIVGRADLDDPLDGTAVWDLPGEAKDSQRRSLWEIMYRTSVAVSRTLDIDQLLRQILDLIFQWVDCDHGCMMLADAESGQLRPSFRKSRRQLSGRRLTISKTILDYVLKNEEGVLTSDAKDDGRWNASASIESGGIREAICVPMRGRYGMVGVIYIDTIVSAGQRARDPDSRIFNEEHLKMLVTIGHQAALAIEDTTYYQSMLQAERLAAIGQTTATLSHHVKNILQGLRGGGYMVTEGLKRENLDSVRTGWRICERTHERIEALVLDMLTISKDRKPERTAIDLRSVISDAVELCKARAREEKIELQWNSPEQFPSMMLDGEATHRAILNLIINALDACADNREGTVCVVLSQHTEAAVIEVIDNGVGIPDADLHRIFSLFESNKGNRGTGLGLPVSLKIAKEHGGNLSVRSAVGSGTTFRLELPWRNNLQVQESKTLSS